MARFVDDQGRENAKSFDKRVEAQAWLDEITAAQVTGMYVAPKAGLISVGDLYIRNGLVRKAISRPRRLQRANIRGHRTSSSIGRRLL
jgi:hypothetical protein